MIIDCHGHYTTAPQAAARSSATASSPALTDATRRPADKRPRHQRRPDPREPRGRAAQAPARARHRPDDLLAARRRHGASHRRRGDGRAMGAHLQRPDPPRRARSIPENFVGVCQLPQSPGVSPTNCIAELERCVNELGFVGCNLNPDPSGGYWKDPPLTDRYWYPIYEKMVELDVPAMVHVQLLLQSRTSTPPARTTSTATRPPSCSSSPRDLFKDFPTLQVHHPARRRRGAVPLGPLSRPGAGHEAAAARRSICSRTCSSTPASITSRASSC